MFASPFGIDKISHLKPRQFATTQLAINDDVEQRDIAEVACDFEAGPDCPDLLRS